MFPIPDGEYRFEGTVWTQNNSTKEFVIQVWVDAHLYKRRVKN